VVGEEESDEPEEDVDVEEEEDVSEEQRVRGAPGGERAGVGVPAGADEGEVEEDGGERDEQGDEHVLEVAAGHGDRWCASSLVRAELAAMELLSAL
jgi:hypothetical protein